MSLTTPSNTLNTFPQTHAIGRVVPISHDLFEGDDASGEKVFPVLFTTLSGNEKRETPETLNLIS
jgi:hypothetical protein